MGREAVQINQSQEHFMCCGTTCDKGLMASELKLQGAREFRNFLATTYDITCDQAFIEYAKLVNK